MPKILRLPSNLFRFSLNDISVILPLPRNFHSLSSSILHVLEEAFNVSREGGNDVCTGLDGKTDYMESRSFDRHFPFTFISPKYDHQCNAQTTVFLLTFEFALGMGLTHFSFSA